MPSAYQTSALRIFGTTATIAVVATTANVVLARAVEGQTCIVTILTGGADRVFIKFGTSAVTATSSDFPCLPGTVQSFTLGAGDTHIAAIGSAAGPTTLYASVGDGL